MADLQQTIEIIFGAIDNTGQGISSVTDGLNNIVEKTSNVTAPLAAVAERALSAEAAVLALGATLLTVSVNEASRFGEKIEEIGSLVNDSPEKVAALKTAIQEFAAQSNSSNFEQIEKAMYVATSNLGDTSKALDILTIAEKGAVVGATQLDSSAALLTRTMNAYGLITDDSATNTANAEKVMAAMFATVQNGDINMQALADNIGKVSSTASAAGVPIETVGAAIAAITGAGVGADQSMTLLNALLKELLSPSDDLSKALGGLSVTANGLPAVMDKLKESTGGSADKVYALFSSSEAAKGALILANDSAGKFDGTINAMGTSVQDFNNNYKNMVGGVEDSTIRLENNTKILLQKVGEPLQDGWADILDGLTAIMHGYSLSIDQGAFDPVFAAFNEFYGDISALLKRIGENLPAALAQVDFTGLIASLKDAGFEIGDLFGGIDLSTPEGLAHAIQFLVDTFESLTRVVSGIIDAWGPVVQGFVAGIDTFNDLDDSSKKTVGNLLGLSQIFETLKGTVTGGADALQTIGSALSVIAGTQAAAAVTSLVSALGVGAVPAAVLAEGLWAILIAVGGLTYGITANVLAWDDYKNRQDTVAESTANLAENQIKIKDRLAEISDRTGIAVSSMDELNKAVDEGRLVFNDATGAYEAAGTGVRDYDTEVKSASESGSWFADAVNDVAKSLGLASDTAKEAQKGFSTLAEAEAYAAREMASSNNVTITYKDGLWQVHDGLTSVTDSTKKTAAATNEAAIAAGVGSKEWKNIQDVLLQTQKQMNDYSIEMAKLADHKYEIDVRANVDLQTAQIEADTQRIASAFTAASDVISSLTSGVTDLWELFGKTDTWDGARDEIRDAALRQEERLNTELQLKEKLTNAVIEQAHATTARLSSGAPLISIDGGNLAPELELVFDKILKFTQIKASQQGLSMLVGL